MKMTNAEKFKQIFGLYATELWSMPESDFLEWLNRDVETTQIGHTADIGKKVSIPCAHENDLIFRQAAIDALARMMPRSYTPDGSHPADEEIFRAQEVFADCIEALEILPSAQPTLHGYNVEHLELIARVLQKEDLPPERLVEALTDIGGIVAIVRDEFEETLRRAVDQCVT